MRNVVPLLNNILVMRKWNSHEFLLLAIAIVWKWQNGRYSLKNKFGDRIITQLLNSFIAKYRVSSVHLRLDYLIKYAYFDKMLFRAVCFYQWSSKVNYKCSLMALAIRVHFRSSNFYVTGNWELTVKIFVLKWGKDNERATSSFRYISEAVKKVLLNSPCMCLRFIGIGKKKRKGSRDLLIS